jgi:D-threo-aldose 1-dehydrogenase
MKMDPFEKVGLGKSKLRVTRLGIGGGALGGLYKDPGDAEAIATVRCALKLGVNFFDTAPLYGYGRSELRLGAALEKVERDRFVLASKVGRVLEPEDPAKLAARICEFDNAPAFRPVFDFSYDGVMHSFEESLKRTQLDRIDLLHIHDPDEHYDQVIREAYPAVHKLRDERVIRAIGAGMNQAEMLVRFAKECDFDCFLLAGRYTLLDHRALKELLPICVERRISIIVGGPFNSGILATGARAGAKFNYQDASPEIQERVAQIEAICALYQVPLKAAALQFPLAHPAVAAVIPGCRSEAEVEENIKMISFDIPPAFWQELRRKDVIPDEAPTAVEQ